MEDRHWERYEDENALAGESVAKFEFEIWIKNLDPELASDVFNNLSEAIKNDLYFLSLSGRPSTFRSNRETYEMTEAEWKSTMLKVCTTPMPNAEGDGDDKINDEFVELVERYLEVVGRYGPNSPQASGIRALQGGNRSFTKFADLVDRIKLVIGGSGIDFLPRS